MKKSILCVVIVLLFSCYSMIHASEILNQDDSKGDNEIAKTTPAILKYAIPAFPVKAEMDHVEGFVILKFIVTKDGDVENPEVLESVPPDYFETAALDALKKYKFKPATENGVQVDCTLKLPFVFSFPNTSFSGDTSIRLQAYRHANKGVSLIEKAEYQKAVEEISEAIKLQSRYGTAYYYRSLAFMKMEEYEKAISDIDRAIELDRKIFGFYNHRGLIYLFWEDYQKAIENFDKSIKIEPKNIVAYIHRGDAYRKCEKYQEAIEDYTSALAFDENLIHVNNNRGYTYFKLNDNYNACSDFKRACELGDCRGLEYLQKKGVCALEGSGSGE
jgi:TonB family protein